MNPFIGHITDFFWNLDRKQFNQIAIGILSASLIILVGGLYWQHSKTKHFKAEMNAANNSRTRVKEILEKNELVKIQRQRAEELLNKDTKFLLKEYFEKLTNSMQLQTNLKTEPFPIITNLENVRAENYEEIHIEAEFVNINMKQLVDLLHALEQNERIVIKKLEIIKPRPQQPTIDAALTISTIQHKTGTAQVVEAE
jgi:hypothetical protein